MIVRITTYFRSATPEDDLPPDLEFNTDTKKLENKADVLAYVDKYPDFGSQVLRDSIPNQYLFPLSLVVKNATSLTVSEGLEYV